MINSRFRESTNRLIIADGTDVILNAAPNSAEMPFDPDFDDGFKKPTVWKIMYGTLSSYLNEICCSIPAGAQAMQKTDVSIHFSDPNGSTRTLLLLLIRIFLFIRIFLLCILLFL